MGHSEKFLGRFLGPLLKTGLLLMKNVIKPLAKSVLTPLELTAEALATDAAATNLGKQTTLIISNQEMNGRPSDLVLRTMTLIISNEEMKYIIKIVKCLDESTLLTKGVNKAIKMKQNNKKVDFSVCY